MDCLLNSVPLTTDKEADTLSIIHVMVSQYRMDADDSDTQWSMLRSLIDSRLRYSHKILEIYNLLKVALLENDARAIFFLIYKAYRIQGTKRSPIWIDAIETAIQEDRAKIAQTILKHLTGVIPISSMQKIACMQKSTNSIRMSLLEKLANEWL